MLFYRVFYKKNTIKIIIMEKLSKDYLKELDSIKEQLLNSDALSTYLDTEEEEDYKELQNTFEPLINELHKKVADKHPLQLIALEQTLLDESFEGLFLPRILGYSVLRGELNEHYKYKYSQQHFNDILMAIASSPNFDYLQLRIGQTIQIGFAMSTDIWVTDLLNKIENKSVKKYLQKQRLHKYYDSAERKIDFNRYYRQFENFNYKTSIFPKNMVELKMHGNVLKEFLLFRAASDYDNSTLIPQINEFLNKEEFVFEPEFIRITLVLGMYFDLQETNFNKLSNVFNKLRKEKEDFDTEFFQYYLQFVDDRANFKIDAVGNLSKLIDKSLDDELSTFFKLMDVVYKNGYVAVETIDAIRKYYNNHEWLSNHNRCLRHSLLNRFSKFFNNLSEKDYTEFFEMFKTFSIYMDIFSNEKFNQNIKNISMQYVKRLMKVYTDKRGRDYQDVKKFVMSTFVELKLYKQKELVEFFKTKRKKKVPNA